MSKIAVKRQYVLFKPMKLIKLTLLAFVFTIFACNDKSKTAENVVDAVEEATADEVKLAQTPPMGWNSFDAYDCRINEAEFKATVDYMADNLLEYGWEYAVIDYILYNQISCSCTILGL